MSVLSKVRGALSFVEARAGLFGASLFLLSLIFAFPNALRLFDAERRPLSDTEVQIVIDGDTIEMAGGRRVRFLGINTPETGQPMSREATLHLKELLKDMNVTLEADVTDKDRYGRLLRYVWVGDLLVNAAMVRDGYAQPYSVPPDAKYQDRILKAEQQARNEQKGLWERSAMAGSIVVERILADAPGDDRVNINGEYIMFKNRSGKTVALTGWILNAGGTQSFVFPVFQLAPLGTVTLYSGSGANTADSLYWNREKNKTPIWNNKGGTILLRDTHGKIVLDQIYKPSSSVVQ